MSARHRLGKLLLRRGLSYGGKNWSLRHKQWLKSLKFEHPADRVVFDDYCQAIELVEERLRRDQGAIRQAGRLAALLPWDRQEYGADVRRRASRLQSVRIAPSLDVLTGPRATRALIWRPYAPSVHHEDGQRPVRCVLVEAAGHYRHKPAVGVGLRVRREGQPASVITIADRAQLRLHKRYWRLTEGRGMVKTKAVTAVARELAGFIWAALHPLATATAA